ncbi:HlyD family type I secretion periplasmic adaptor subunit [Rickettsia endosymbiont of Polydrusus tereticollis]|uniref:HlyD family type I secretion periplasmic adaptor subunit n=1 Tax=Rickettsia endosymbiont of Polydrusus tereticollis TaxID=3066251 RepID=UPI003132FAA4
MQESKNNKPQITPEQLKQLLSLKSDAMFAKGSKRKILSNKILTGISKIIEFLLIKLDRFVNFITRKTDKDRNNVVQTARSPIIFGVYVIIFLVLIGGMWASFAPLDSGAVSVGIVMPSTNKKTIQHHEGGIIAGIFVAQGDKVKAGDKLIELDETRIKSEHESILNQYRNALATENRLIAERDNLEQIEFAEFLMEDINIPKVAKIIHTQENLFRSKKEVYRSEKNALNQRIAQLEKKIEGLEAKKVAAKKTAEVLQDRLKALKILMQKGFVQKATLLEMEAKEANSRSEVAGIDTEIAGTRHAITESEISIINLQNKYTEKTLTDLREAQVQVAHLREKFTSLTDSLSRIIIKSPVDGVINVLNYHTIGGFISPGQPILEISPTNDPLIIEAKVSQKNIDAVHEGLVAKIRFSAFKSRTTPLFTGKVVKISPDIVQDRNQNPAQPDNYYIARIEIDMDEFNKIAKSRKLELHPGMQAEVQIVTGTRTLLKYLLDPLTDTAFKAFREK